MTRLFNFLGVSLFTFLLFSCSWIIKDEDKIRYNYWDTINIPDKFNTGPDENTSFTTISENTNINGVLIANRVQTNDKGEISVNQYQISSYQQTKDMPDKAVIRNYDFSDKKFVIQNSDRYSRNKHITFENCKFAGFRNDAAPPGSSRVYVTFNHCSFAGGVGSSYMTLNDCKIGGFTSDAMNPVTQFYANNLYVYNLVTQGLQGEVHIDGIQIYGDQSSRNNEVNGKWICTKETGNIHFNNLRFEMPQVYFENQNSYVNACIMVQLEFSDVENILFENLTVNGGGKYFPLRLNYGKNHEKSVHSTGWSYANCKMRNVRVTDNVSPKIYIDGRFRNPQTENISYTEQLYVTSVWKDSNGIAHVITSNDTKDARYLTVMTDVGTYNFYVPHSPSDWVLSGELNKRVKTSEQLVDENGRAYTTYRWEDFPFDLDFKIPGNPRFVVCYEGGKKIRYVPLDGKTHHYDEIDETIRN